MEPRITIWASKSTSGFKPTRVESRDFHKYLQSYVHSNIIHDSQKVEAVIDREIDKQNVVQTYSGILLSLKKGHSDACYNMGERWHNAKSKKRYEKLILHDSTYMRYLECHIHRNQKWKSGMMVPRYLEERVMMGYCLMGTEFQFWKLKRKKL